MSGGDLVSSAHAVKRNKGKSSTSESCSAAVLRTPGRIAKLRSDLLHFSNESIDRQIAMIGPYSGAFATAARASGRQAGWTDLVVRPWWRFVRGYLFRLGFLDGLPGYYIAWSNAFTVVTRYAKLRDSARESRSAEPAAPPPAAAR